MKVGDRVELKLKSWWSSNNKLGTVFAGTITEVRPKAIEVEGYTVLRQPPPDQNGALLCRRCSRPLHEEASKSIGYGPDCAVEIGLTNKFIRDLRRALTRDERQAGEKHLKRKLWIPLSQVLAHRTPGEAVIEEAQVARVVVTPDQIREGHAGIAENMRHEEVSDAPMALALPFDCEPRSYQWRAVRFMLQVCREQGVGVPLWDLMGLGKTIEAILFMMLSTIVLAEEGKHGPCVVVCPPIMALTWKRELEKWWQGVKVQVLKGYSDTAKPKVHVYIVPWSILAQGWEPLRDSQGNVKYQDKKRKDGTIYQAVVPDTNRVKLSGSLLSVIEQRPLVVVGDECHNMKSPGAQRTKAAMQLVLPAEHVAMMTGTAVLNRVEELITQLDVLGILEKEFGGREKFEIEFAARHLEWQSVGNGRRKRVYKYGKVSGSKLVELHQRLVPYVIRRRTEHVIKDMPPLTVSRVAIELANRAEYDRLEEEISLLPPMARMGPLMQLRQLLGLGKIPAGIEWIENFLECEEKLIVFATHIAVRAALIEHFEQWKPALLLSRSEGSTDKKRQVDMDRFQNDPDCLLAICSSGAAKEGITLTAGKNVLDLELDWNPGIQSQKWKRAHRLGQTDPVTVWVLAAEESYDDTLLAKLSDKRWMAGEVLDGAGEVLDEEVIRDAIVSDLVRRVAKRKKKRVA